MKIGITYTASRYANYENWIKNTNENITIIQLSNTDEDWEIIEDCDGILLTGGIDIHPSFYDNATLDYPFAPETFDIARDEFEMHVFETALNLHIPVLAICRGLQLVNISLGGTLIQDLEKSNKNDHRRHDETDEKHPVLIKEKNSLLFNITKQETGTINSAHHQAIDILSDELIATAFSKDDQVIEAVEWKEKNDKNWLLAVQWHPERMLDKDENPFSYTIKNAFFDAIKNNKNA